MKRQAPIKANNTPSVCVKRKELIGEQRRRFLGFKLATNMVVEINKIVN